MNTLAMAGGTSKRRSGLRPRDVCAELQRMILNGQLRPRSKLVQGKLARHFGLGQGVIREALLKLEACGLVESIANRGAFVAALDRAKLIECLEVRELQEALAARRCCNRVNRAQVRELKELAERIYQLGLAGDEEKMASAYWSLHSRLIRLSGSNVLVRLADSYQMLAMFVRDTRDPYIVRDEHLAILHAIEDGLASEAERLVREHVAAVRASIEGPSKPDA